jgi:hypothetical protein
MSARCPAGHDSVAVDYCDECGAPIEAAVAAPAVGESVDDSTTVTVVDRCPSCGWIRMPGDRFCEQCRLDFSSVTLTPAPEPGRWTATIEADRAFYEWLAPDAYTFPAGVPARVVVLDGDEILVGRRSREQRVEPDIDLSGSGGDPAVSRRHARLVRGHDGSFSIVDLHSANGTWLNDDTEPIAPDVPVRLVAGDRVHLGAWTTITLTAR